MISNVFNDTIYNKLMQNIIKEVHTQKQKSFSFLSNWKDCQSFVDKIQSQKPLFILVIGSTKTALIPGISAAGRNVNDLKYTPALDAEFLVSKEEEFKKKLPISPHGIPSPIIISKAMTNLLNLEICVVDTGAFVKPAIEHINLNMGPAECLTTGGALGKVKTDFLFKKGEKLAVKLKNHPYYVIGECVPGGTTTALSVLCALGINAFSNVSSSFPEGNNFLKNQTVKDALLENAHLFSEIKKNALKAVDFFGDPMQAFVAGFIKGAQQVKKPIMLAGGSQMVAVYFLAKSILDYHPHDTVVATTSWIANDKNASIKKLAQETGTPLIASRVNFEKSSYQGLQAYEKGHIKEGAGAGGLLVLASLYLGFSQQQIVSEIEKLYKKYDLNTTPKASTTTSLSSISAPYVSPE